MKITEQVTGFARPVVESLGCRLWDVEYVREGADWFSGSTLTKTAVDITDCEAISQGPGPHPGRGTPSPDSYHFEVCPPVWSGAEAPPGISSSFSTALCW